ncbi:hypothetical protein GIB67_020201 [Kingdonia uniflora]|uniref:Uncharacterized protein n=1 Tax=Kingdonia uniflora TaxID=39325 RepID=A0A7J7NU10_9MAGN|nr:hypothetical protein GIB67_020201 [Kingdonia uniflora]
MAPKLKAKIPPTASHRKRLISEREDPSYPNFNKPHRVPAKRSKTNSSMAEQVREDSTSGSVPQVAVTPQEVKDFECPFYNWLSPQGNVQGESTEASSAEDSSSVDSQASVLSTYYFNYNKTAHVSDNTQFEAFLNPTVEEQGTKTTDEEGIHEDNNNESNDSEANEYGPMDTSLLMSFETQSESSSSWTRYFLFPTKKGIDMSAKYLNFFENKNSEITWSWGAMTLAHLYYSIGASSIVNVKALACCTHYIAIVSFTKLCPDVVDLDEDDDGRILGDEGGVSHRKNTIKCESLKEANDRLQADIQAKQVVDSICEKDYSKTIKKPNDKTLKCNLLRESNKKLLEDVLENAKLKKSLTDLHLQFKKKIMLECENLAAINEKLMEEVVNQKLQPLTLNLVVHSEENIVGVEDWK